jgi:hypothetical protein
MKTGPCRRTAIGSVIWYAVMALSSGALVSGLILWVDMYELARGTVDAQLCEIQLKDMAGRYAGANAGCGIRFGYLALVLLYGLVIVPFWLLVFGAPVLVIRIAVVRVRGMPVPARGLLILETIAVYVLAVILSSVAAMEYPAWYFGPFNGLVGLLLLALAPLFAAVLCLRPRRRETKQA